ncbi:hypothetical protein BaRGS_00003296 [Batillaria attramentaria]|uniref:Uncharacterized protein n=1 Tax=Batillaria attramentaria TaxID=370345 RepID=A0ABD0M231_9CAEN
MRKMSRNSHMTSVNDIPASDAHGDIFKSVKDMLMTEIKRSHSHRGRVKNNQRGDMKIQTMKKTKTHNQKTIKSQPYDELAVPDCSSSSYSQYRKWAQEGVTMTQ